MRASAASPHEVEAAPGTVVVFADIACPWSHVALFRLHRARESLGMGDDVVFDMRAFPLEYFNGQPTPKRVLDAEIPVAGGLEPEAGWAMWRRREWDYPVTTLLALEAVQAAKGQGLRAGEQLDHALRSALFGRGINVSMRHEILAVAEDCGAVDADALREALDEGRARRMVFEQAETARAVVQGSPHFFLPDASDVHNPGVRLHWHGKHGVGFPIVDSDEPAVYEDIVKVAAHAVGKENDGRG
jgi:predicted DsbA family dithiol-disulfide isomerase